MRLVTFVHNGDSRLGAWITRDAHDEIVDLYRADARISANILQFLQGGERSRELAENVLAKPGDGVLDARGVTLQAPIPRPGKIICVGLNYRDHAAESNLALPEVPVIFSKYANAVIGPNQPIILPRVTDQVDYEAELAFVIGRRARHVLESEALSFVAGYVPLNDVSARDYQMRTSQWTIGKTFDTFAPMGPALVTADEIPDPANLDIRLRIGEELLQNSNTRNLIFTVPYLVAYLSQVMTLEPGDLISTGTPGGVGFARTPNRFLKPGEIVEVEIERLGTLSNPVIAEA
jgi:acylpyruvate hydrolase